MIKSTVKFEDFDGNEVTQDLYFHLEKLEMLELEIEYDGGISRHIETLVSTSAGKDAYYVFKDLVRRSYGKKLSNMKFEKKDPITGASYFEELESTPALSEFIFDLIEGRKDAAEWVNGLFPAKMVREAKELAEKEKAENTTSGEVVAVAPEPVKTEKKVTDYSRDELLKMPQEEFDALAGTDPSKMDPAVLQVAFQRKASQ